ncbi:MAG: NAD(P)/FAD-dependent oxidoreductase [Xanthomonadaceae bacterium]|nr:NAD(P)/FAD-dependent oxidoreductase [Xanthomonadaceae bacterium]
MTIIGGGPAGCATALALARRGIHRVTVIEAGDYSAIRVGESIPPQINAAFSRLGILDDFLAEKHEPCVGSCSVWGNDQPGFNDFIASPHGPGWHLDRRRFEAFLARCVRQRGMQLRTRTRFRAIEPQPGGGFRLEISDESGRPQTLEADVVVDAGGVQALLATRLGARKRILDRLLVVCSFFELGRHEDFARQTLLEAVEYGWWYAARLPDRKLVVAVASDATTLKSMRLNEARQWRQSLARTRHLATALSKAEWRRRKLNVLLAASSILEPCAGPGWLAVGDAASCYDPISAQGIHKALGNALAAADAIVAGMQTAEPAPGPSSLDQAMMGPAGRYSAGIRREFQDYLAGRNHFYDLERRWPQSGFWSSRRKPLAGRADARKAAPGPDLWRPAP